jgi:carbohydrate esterase-like sialic acid-specific acetylesterase
MWFQGEADAVDGTTRSAYEASLEDLIRRVRLAAQNPSMHVLIVGLADAPFRQDRRGYEKIRAVLREVAARDPRAVYVTAEGLPLGRPAQPYHLATEGYRALGVRIAAMVQ